MIALIIITIVVGVIAGFMGSIFGAEIRFGVFPGILIGSSNRRDDYEYTDEDSDEVKEVAINQLQFYLIFISMTILWKV
jgi:hypothetical protein|tara:strand:- start:268 stop:504 length:237 start_codon:yes stop_codon:yes gene_type:complete